ncbi:hypothetical protein J4444_04785 [Candidatus Woesearchaeota archaeon]|nr:hypothetical protein [Candidatus Woesearchaeota archaeon]
MLFELTIWHLVIFLILLIISFFLGKILKTKEIKEHRRDAISRSRYVLFGQFSEQLAPFLPNFNFNPNECRFIGKPIDFLVFKGLDEQKVSEIVFVEVKSGNSKLNGTQNSLKDAVEKKKVRWEEYRVDSNITKR